MNLMYVLDVFIKDYMTWLMSAITIFNMWAIGNYKKIGWLVGFWGQGLWLIYILWTAAWGLLPLNFAMWFVNGRNYSKWAKENG